MAAHSEYLAGLTLEDRTALEGRLLERQSGKCFICDDTIDPVLHQDQLDVDHIVPLAEQGADDEQNFALTHASCNRSKGASDLRVARRMAEFEKLQQQALERGERGANLGHVLAEHGGAKAAIRLQKSGGRIEFTLSAAGDETIQRVPLYQDPLSSMRLSAPAVKPRPFPRFASTLREAMA